jgi:hypothetical protein
VKTGASRRLGKKKKKICRLEGPLANKRLGGLGNLAGHRIVEMSTDPDYSRTYRNPKRKREGGNDFLSLALRVPVAQAASQRPRFMNHPS